MNSEDIISTIKRRLGNRTDQDTNILTEINFQQELLELAPALPWFLFKADPGTPLVTVAGTETIALPTDYLRAASADSDEGTIWITDSDGERQKVARAGYDELIRRFDSESNDLPVGYAIRGTTMYFRPIPDAVYTLVFPYLASVSAFANDSSETLWGQYAPDLIMAETILALATDLQMNKPKHAVDVARARKRMDDETTAREEAGRLRRMGSS